MFFTDIKPGKLYWDNRVHAQRWVVVSGPCKLEWDSYYGVVPTWKLRAYNPTNCPVNKRTFRIRDRHHWQSYYAVVGHTPKPYFIPWLVEAEYKLDLFIQKCHRIKDNMDRQDQLASTQASVHMS